MTYATINVNRLVFNAASITNAAKKKYPTTTADITDPLRPPEDFTEAIKSCDAFIVGAIKDNPNHRLRPLFYDTKEYSNGDQVTDFTLGGVSVKYTPDGGSSVYRPGKEVTPDILSNYQEDVLLLDSKNGYYATDGTFVYFIGEKLKVDRLKLPDDPPVFPMTPVEYELPVLWGLLATVFPKDGKFVQAAEHFGGLWKTCQELIRSGATGEKFPQLKLPPI